MRGPRARLAHSFILSAPRRRAVGAPLMQARQLGGRGPALRQPPARPVPPGSDEAPRFVQPRCALLSASGRRPVVAARASTSEQPPIQPRAALALASASAVLGPCCDSLHSRAGVLTYAHPDVNFPPWLITCWWVPVLFGGAGIIIGLGVPALDVLLGGARPPARSWPAVLACIAGFVSLYGASAALEGPCRGHPGQLDAILAMGALAHWAVFDRTPAAAVLGLAAAVAGPAVEVGLITVGHLYAYADPAVFYAIPTWIWAVYAAGGAAVGGLGRRVVADLEGRRGEK